MRWLFVAIGALLHSYLLTDCARAQSTQPKIALVVGNSDYNRNGILDTDKRGVEVSVRSGFANDLPNARNDATDVANALRSIGFDVHLVIDADRETLERAFETFKNSANDAGNNSISVVYYAGHAINIPISSFLGTEGHNYLIPVGAQIPDFDPESRHDASEAKAILGPLGLDLAKLILGLHPNGSTILIFDACRDNPWPDLFERSLFGAGAGPTISTMSVKALQEQNFYLEKASVAYSTEPGQTANDGSGRNSPYAEALIRWIARPNLSVGTVFERVKIDVVQATGGSQRPWTRNADMGSSVGGASEVCLAGCQSPR